MNVGLYRSAVAMSAQQRRLDAIAANLSNLGTVGFKRGVTSTHEVEVQRERGPVRGVVTRSEVDFAQGNLQRTGRDLDVALYGEGFFAVEAPSGEVYTRDGSFHLTEEGVLVTEEGFAVAWDELHGAIDPVGQPIAIDEQGNVRQGLEEIGRLRVVDFEEKRALAQDRLGFWRAPRGAREALPNAAVHQFALEDSNANGVEEMVAMIGVQRSFEVVAKALSAIDESYQRLTRPF